MILGWLERLLEMLPDHSYSSLDIVGGQIPPMISGGQGGLLSVKQCKVAHQVADE